MASLLIAAMAFDSQRGGGSVRVAYDLAILLARRGHSITVVCEDSFDRGVEKETVEGISILRYSLPKLNSLNIRRHKHHIQATRKLTEKYLTGEPDIVHGHHLFQYSAVLDLFYNRSRCCYTIHSPAIDELRIAWSSTGIVGRAKSLLGLPVIRTLERSLLSRSSKLSTLSIYTKDLIAHEYGNALANKIDVIPGWVDPARFYPLNENDVSRAKKRLGWPADVPVIFALRRLEPRMGLENLIRALAIVKKRGHRIFLVLGGNGTMRDQLKLLRDKLNLGNDLMFMGFVPGELVPLAFGACDASVIPTSRLECFGLIALEALACGRTTLVTPTGALPEVMKNIEPAWISKDATALGIADIIIDYLKKNLPSHSPKKLHDIIVSKYSSESAILHYERVLMNIDI